MKVKLRGLLEVQVIILEIILEVVEILMVKIDQVIKMALMEEMEMFLRNHQEKWEQIGKIIMMMMMKVMKKIVQKILIISLY